MKTHSSSKTFVMLATLATRVACLFAVVLVSGCASTTVTDRQRDVYQKLPRPDCIWVYDFAATAAGVPADSTLAREYTLATAPQTAGQIATGRQLGNGIASELIWQIRNLGLNAQKAFGGELPHANDIVLRGYLVSIDEGSASKRVVIGFGSGTSELRTMVEGFQVSPQGLRKLGSGTVQSAGAKTPGAAMGAATFLASGNPAGLIVSSGMKLYGEKSGKSTIEGRAKATADEIAKVLKQRFQEEGWIY